MNATTAPEFKPLDPSPEPAGEWPSSDPANRVVYVMDVMEEMGHQCAVRSYWDLGPWALQSRQWRPMPAASQDIFQVQLVCHLQLLKGGQRSSVLGRRCCTMPAALQDFFWVLGQAMQLHRVCIVQGLTAKVNTEYMVQSYCMPERHSTITKKAETTSHCRVNFWQPKSSLPLDH